MEKNFCIYNNEITKIETLNTAPIFAINDYERTDIRLYNTHPLFLASHLQNICENMKKKGVTIPQQLTFANIDHQIHRVLNVNKVYKGGVCTLLVFWQKFPTQSEPAYCIFVKPLETLQYNFSTRGTELTYQSESATIYPFVPNSTYSEQEETFSTNCIINAKGDVMGTDRGDLLVIANDTIHLHEKTEPITTIFAEHLACNQWKTQRHNGIPQDIVANSQEIIHCGTFIGVQWINKLTINNDEGRILGYDYTKQIVKEFTTFISTQG